MSGLHEGFPMADLVIESIIRDGFADVRRDPEIIEVIFAPLTRAYANRKYGESEICKIKKLVTNREVSIVHSFAVVDSKVPCISLSLASDREDTRNAYLGYHKGFLTKEHTTPEQLAGNVIVADITPTAYDVNSGNLSLPDTVNLAAVNANQIFVDAAGAEHVIVGGINNDLGAKNVTLETESPVDLGAGGSINSSIDFDLYGVNMTTEDFEVVLGIHTKDALTTKYLYTLIKYFVLSRQQDLCSRGIILGTYSGSDFSRNVQYQADMVFTRFLHVQGKIQPTWRTDKVQLVDNISVNIQVPKDKFGNDILDLEDQTVTVAED